MKSVIEAVRKAAQRFREYEGEHRAKAEIFTQKIRAAPSTEGKPGKVSELENLRAASIYKADHNREMAETMEATLKALETVDVIHHQLAELGERPLFNLEDPPAPPPPRYDPFPPEVE